MTRNGVNDSLALDDEDRLPWLEPAYDDEDAEEISLLRLVAFIAAGLALLGLIVGGVYLIRDYISAKDDPQVIAAPEGNYKVRAEDADAKKFDGEGDASFATSEGLDRGGRIDPSRLPETPVTAGAASQAETNGKAAATAAAAKVSAPVADRTGESARPAAAAPTPKLSGPVIQLGAYASEAIARDGWKRISGRFDYLADLSYNIEPVTVGGTKFYRLRAAAGANAGTICGKLKVAGENCIVVN